MLQQAIVPRNALDGRGDVRSGSRLSVSVAPDCARFSLRIGSDALEAAGRAFGCVLPARIGGLARREGRVVVCLGPDEWFILAPAGEGPEVEARFAALDQPHSLVDVGHREVGIEVRGAAAPTALGAACALDVDAMPEGSATRTILDRAQVILVKHASDHYRIEVWSSFATHVWGLLAAAAREIELDL